MQHACWGSAVNRSKSRPTSCFDFITPYAFFVNERVTVQVICIAVLLCASCAPKLSYIEIIEFTWYSYLSVHHIFVLTRLFLHDRQRYKKSIFCNDELTGPSKGSCDRKRHRKKLVFSFFSFTVESSQPPKTRTVWWPLPCWASMPSSRNLTSSSSCFWGWISDTAAITWFSAGTAVWTSWAVIASGTAFHEWSSTATSFSILCTGVSSSVLSSWLFTMRALHPRKRELLQVYTMFH